MSTRISSIVLLLCLSLPAAAQFKTISAAYEISLSNFTVPATPSAGVTFSRCDDCERFAIRVTPDTEYTINDQPVTLTQFRKAIFQITDRAAETIIVLHHLESDTVLSVSASI